MIIQIEKNDQKGPGYALITMRSRSGEALPELASAPEFMIASPGRGEYLGNGQWLQSEIKLLPDAYSMDKGLIILEVGPPVVDNLEMLENYKISVFLPGGERTGALICKNIVPSPMQGGGTGFGNFETKQDTPDPKPIPEPEPIQEPPLPAEPTPEQNPPLQASPSEPIPEPQPVFRPQPVATPVYTLPDFTKQQEPPFNIEQEPGQNINFEQLSLDSPSPKQKGGGKKIALIILIILLVIALIVGTCTFLGNQTEEDPALPGDEPSQEQVDPQDSSEDNQDPPVEQPSEQPSEEPSEQPSDDTPPDVPSKPTASPESLQMSRGMLRENSSDADIRRALTLMPLDESTADANFLLREELAERGDAESMYLLGQFYDPTQTAPHGSIIKDPEQALHYYQQAKSGGWQSSGPALEGLKTWLETEAASGNPQAKNLLNSME